LWSDIDKRGYSRAVALFLQSVDIQEMLNTVGVQLAAAIGQFGVTVLPVLGGS
jgi:hypothetical protein